MKVGDYVRTKDGIILKVKDIEDIYTTDNIYIGMSIYDNEGHFVNDVEIIKSSPNIIDLIEVGDYVNGYKVLFAGATTWDNDGNVIDKRVKINYDGYDRWLSEDFIKSVVTKEQFKSMEYKIGE